MTAINKKKLTYSLWSIVYLALTVVIVVSATSIFNNYYYESVYVSGASMNPTFVGNGSKEKLGSDYGIIDKSSGAKHNVKRFQIVTTYYPGDNPEAASYKIKRVIAKPGDRFKIVHNALYLYHEGQKNDGWGKAVDMPFDRTLNYSDKNVLDTTLGSDQYFLAGDNWDNSYDSFNIGPVNYDLLVGVVVKMQGLCIVDNGRVVEKEPYAARYFLGVDY